LSALAELLVTILVSGLVAVMAQKPVFAMRGGPPYYAVAAVKGKVPAT